MPIVVLTSNNSRELTEALKRRCLYLWLDYPEPEREMEIVRSSFPELPEALAQRLVEVVRMVRALDLKKPPSIAESIDWARTLLLLGADDIDRETFEQSMSIIVKHRTDIDLVAERQGENLPSPYGLKADTGPPGLTAKLLAFCDELRNEGAAVGTSEILDAFAALEQVPWTSQDDFREALAATLVKSQEDRRLFELLFDRWFFRATEAEAIDRGDRRGGTAPRGRESDWTSMSCASRFARQSSRATMVRCGTWRDWQSPPLGARARDREWSVSMYSESGAPLAYPQALSSPPTAQRTSCHRSSARISPVSSAT